MNCLQKQQADIGLLKFGQGYVQMVSVTCFKLFSWNTIKKRTRERVLLQLQWSPIFATAHKTIPQTFIDV